MTSPSTIEQKFLDKPNELGVVAVGFNGGQAQAGVETGPRVLIDSGLLTQLSSELGFSVHHDGLIHNYTSLIPSSDPPHRGMLNPRATTLVTEALATQVYEQGVQGRMVLTLGGDHSIAVGTVSGTARAVKERLGKDIAVIWVDAHADINTPESSDSGNIHGMPVSFLTGLARGDNDGEFGWVGRGEWAGVGRGKGNGVNGTNGVNGNANGNGNGANGHGEGFQAPLSVKKLVYIGLRDVDRGEKKILRENGIKAFSMHDIDRHGIGRVMELAIAHIGNDTPIHLSFDVDALDPQWAPSTGTPVRGGLTLREGDFIAECVAETGNLVAMDLVEVNPSLEESKAEDTVRAGCSLVRCALGDTLL